MQRVGCCARHASLLASLCLRCQAAQAWAHGCACARAARPSRIPPSHPPGPRQVLGAVGSARKRVLLLWQAVELSKFLGFPNTRTLDVAR